MKRRVVAIANKSVFVFATSFNRLDLESTFSPSRPHPSVASLILVTGVSY